MRPWQRILLVISLLTAFVAAAPAGNSQAEPITLTPGLYAGRFYYSVDWTIIDNQSQGGVTSNLNNIGNFYIEGLVTLRVDKNGKILPGVKINPNSTTAYELHYLTITPVNCNIRAYLSADSNATIKFQSTGTSQSFITSLKLENVRPMHFERTGNDGDCPHLESQEVLTGWINKHIEFVNKTKNLTFVVMNATKEDLIGSILLDRLPIRTTTPGGFIVNKDEGRFVLHKIDPLAPLDDDSLAPLVEDPLAPLGEWRTK